MVRLDANKNALSSALRKGRYRIIRAKIDQASSIKSEAVLRTLSAVSCVTL